MESTKEETRWTSKIWQIICEHKFLTTIVAIFISFSLLNGFLIVNFIKILEENIYIL